MRALLLVSFFCIGYAMEHERINGDDENQRLFDFQPQQEHCLRNKVRWCIDHHTGTLVLCGSLVCIGGFIGLTCWTAGGVKVTQASIVAQVME